MGVDKTLIEKDEYSKSTFIRESHAIIYSSKHNLYEELEQVLNYLQDFTTPFFEGINNQQNLFIPDANLSYLKINLSHRINFSNILFSKRNFFHHRNEHHG